MTSTVEASATAPAGGRFHVLDGMRGFAAIVVMLYHYVGAAEYPVLRNSYIAVDLFFILSGFVIYHSYAHRLRGGMTAGTFINKRFARLAPTVTVGVLLGAAASLAYYAESGKSFDPLKFSLVHAGNIAFIPAFLDYDIPPTGLRNLFPSNAPLWSIFFEFVASAGFVWMARSPRWGLAVGTLAAFGLFVASCMVFASTSGRPLTADVGWAQNTLLYGFPRVFSAFMCGTVVYWLTQEPQGPLTRRLPSSAGRLAAFAVYAGTLAILLFPSRLGGLYPFLAIGLLSPILIALGARARPKARWLITVSNWLGQLSFPLYCVHVPVRRLIETGLKAAGLTWLPWKVQILLSIGAAFAASVLVLLLLDGLKARQRVSALLKPITG